MIGFGVNVAAVFAAGIVATILGFLWDGPPFGKQWMKLTGKKMEDMGGGKDKMPLYALGGLIGALVTAFVLAALIGSLGAFVLADALIVAVAAWIGFQATILYGDVLWDNKPVGLFILNAGYQLVS